MDRNVVCIRWGDVYPGDYVNVLYNAVRANLDGPFRFVCLTNDRAGIDPKIETKPIVDIGVPEKGWRGGAWPKLSVFVPQLHDLTGRALFIDLDTFILGDMEPFMVQDGRFRASHKSSYTKGRVEEPAIYRWGRPKIDRIRARLAGDPERVEPVVVPEHLNIKKSTLATGLFAFDIGKYGHVVDAFRADPEGALKYYQNEQHFLENQIDDWEPWPEKSLVSYKFALRRPALQSYFRHPRRPPDGISVLAFHGKPRPRDMATRWVSSRKELPYAWIGPVGWVREYWNRYNVPV